MRTLSVRELNRALLARQLLLSRERLSVPEALSRTAGLQAQHAPAVYVGLWTRLEGFDREALTRALEQRSAVQGTLMRSTIHVVAAHDYWAFALAIRRARRRVFLSQVRGLLAPHMTAAARQLRRQLGEGDGTMNRADIESMLGRSRFAGVGFWIDLVRVPPSGTWEHPRATVYADAETWLPPPTLTVAHALEHLVQSYLRAFGPAPRRDIASWSGLHVADIEPAIQQLQLAEYRDAEGEVLVDVVDGLLPDADTAAPVRFLPVWDATLLAHARRAGIVPEELRARVFSTRHPQGTGTFLVDGAVAGGWSWEDGRVVVDEWTRLDRASRRALNEETERLTSFHAEPSAQASV
ncbi:MAG: winged helix DNA-binding domain-containing protein [Deltaproteobacteria bacterium]|nr:winged helix DNA-binding domain-containing protein [Deltaproteobacteria bacterium]